MLFLVTCFMSVVWTFTLLAAEERLPLRPESCIMPPPEGDCGGEQQNRWFFDAGTSSCRQFLFHGCPGVGNTFETQAECHRICVDVAEAEDDLEPQPEVPSSAETLSTSPVDPSKSDQQNAKFTTVVLLGTNEETKDTTERVNLKMASPPPPLPSGIQKKPSESVEVEVTRVAAAPNQKASDKTTLPLAPEKDQEDAKSTPGQSKDIEEDPGTALLTPEMPQEPVAANDQPIPSNSDLGTTERSGGLATPLMAIEGQPEPSPEEPSPDDEQRRQTERSGPSADKDDDSGTEEPAGFQNPDRPTEVEHEAVPVRSKEEPEEENREEEPNENPSSSNPRMPLVMPSRGEVGITSVLATSKQPNMKELQREFTPKLTFALRGSTGMERVQKENTDNQELLKKITQATRNLEDSEQRKVSSQAFAEKSRPEILITNTVPIESRTAALGVPVTRSPVREKSPLDSRTGSDDLPRDQPHAELPIAKEGRNDIGITHRIPETTPLLDRLPHRASVLMSKTPRRLTSNPSERSTDSRNGAQPPAANGPPAATPFSMNGMPKKSENPFTGGNTRIASGNLALRTKFEVPAMRSLAKSEQDYRRPAFCSLHKVRGHCTEHLLRWYFNPFNGSCQSFTYSGCGGNPNNFETIETCFVTCTGRKSDRSRSKNNFQEDASNPRMPSRFAEPDWSPVSASLAEPPPPPPQEPAGLQFFLDMLRRKLPPPPPPPPFLRSLAFPHRSGGPGDNVADQKMLLGDKDVEDSGRPEEQRRARQSMVPSEKRFRLLGKASESDQHKQLHKQQQPIPQRSRSSEFRESSNLPEKAMIDSDIATLRNLLQQDSRESSVSVFDPRPLGRNRETSQVQKSRPTGYSDARKADDNTRADKRAEMDQPHFEERPPAVQRTRTRQNRQSPAIGFQRFGHFLNNGHPMPQELKNFRWIEQAIVVSDLAPGRLNLPFWFGDEMMENPRHPGQTPNWRDSTGPRPDGNTGNPQNALTLRRNSMLFETRRRAKKLQDFEMEKRLASRVSYTANGLVPHAMKPDRMAISLDRGLPRQAPKQPQSSFSSSSSHSFPLRGKGNAEIPFHVLHLTRPLVEQLAGRTGVGRVEQDSRRVSHSDADSRRSGSREDVRAERVVGREKNWQEQDKERSAQRRRNNNDFSQRLPGDRLTFLQIFVNRDQMGPASQPHFPKPSIEENQYLSRSQSLPRSQIDPPRFQTNQNGGYFPPPPPPRQMSPRQRPVQISRETMTDERDWLPASEFDGPRHNGEFVNARSGSLESDPNEDSKDRRWNPIPFVCQLPLEPGSCAGYQAKWFYNQRKGFCELFYYGGCSGNGNRFETRDECLQTCDGESDLRTDETEARSLDDTFGRRPSEISGEDVIVLTSPVYGEVEENVKDTATVKVKYPGYDHVGRPQMSTHVPFLSGHGKRVELESHVPRDIEVDSKATEWTTTSNGAGKSAITELAGKSGDAEAKKEEDLSKTFSTQYIAIVTALGVVGIAVVLMVILSIVRLCRRVKKSKREHSIQEVIKSHMYGDLPHVLYSESPSSAVSEKERPDKK